MASWAILRTDLRTGQRRVMPGRYTSHDRAEAGAARLNDHVAKSGQRAVFRAMTLREAEAMAEQTNRTRRARLKVARRSRS